MWPHAVIVDEGLRGLAAAVGRARTHRVGRLVVLIAGVTALAVVWSVVGGRGAPPGDTAPHVQQRPQVGPPVLSDHDVFLGFRPRIERPPGARSPVLRQRTPLRPRLERPDPRAWARTQPTPASRRS